MNGETMSLFDLAKKFQPKTVVVEGESFYVARLSALQKDRFDLQYGAFQKINGGVGLRGFLTAFCLCEKDGKPTYDSGSKSEANEAFLKHVQSVCELPLALVEPLFEAACDINGFNEGSAKN